MRTAISFTRSRFFMVTFGLLCGLLTTLVGIQTGIEGMYMIGLVVLFAATCVFVATGLSAVAGSGV